MYSRVRASGLGNDWPYQPSTDLRTGDAKPEHVPAAGEVIERQGRHRARRRGARGQLDHRGAQPQPMRRRTPPGQRRVGVDSHASAVNTASKSGVFGRGHEFAVVVRRRAPQYPS